VAISLILIINQSTIFPQTQACDVTCSPYQSYNILLTYLNIFWFIMSKSGIFTNTGTGTSTGIRPLTAATPVGANYKNLGTYIEATCNGDENKLGRKKKGMPGKFN
jgi:hypothetical protein